MPPALSREPPVPARPPETQRGVLTVDLARTLRSEWTDASGRQHKRSRTGLGGDQRREAGVRPVEPPIVEVSVPAFVRDALGAECRAAVATCRITSLLRQASRNLLRGMVQRTDRWPCRRAARSLTRSASESRPRSRQPAALAFRRRCCLSSSARTPPTPAGTLAFARRSGSQAEPERQLSRLVQLGSRGGPGEDSRIREKEENDDRRLSVLPQSGRSPCCKIRARGFAAGI